MATFTASLTRSGTFSDAEFQAVNTFISASLESAGITKTADTGQIDTTTENWPGSNNTSAGYEIRQFTDALASTKPVVFKMEYGRGGSTNYYNLWLTIGTGSDGSGAITGELLSRTEMGNPLASSPATAAPSFISGGTNRFVIVCYTDSSSNCFFVAMERTLDATKTVTDRGINFLYGRQVASAQFRSRFIPFSGLLPAEDQAGGALMPASQTSGLHSSGDVAVYPVYTFGAGELIMPQSQILAVFQNDFGAGNVEFTANVLGSNQVCIAIDTTAPMAHVARQQNNARMAIRYD